jgi:hypothetical protein
MYPAEVKGLILVSPPTDNQEILDPSCRGTFGNPLRQPNKRE